MTQVLITRPLEASQQLAGELVKVGLSPIVLPLYSFSARQPELDLNLTWPVGTNRKLAVFTSPRAVQYGLSHIAREQLNDLDFAALGSATRAMLEAAGFDVDLQARSGFTSEDLLKIPGLGVNPGVAVIFCAPGGRKALVRGLEALGWTVVQAMVYERIPLKLEAGQLDTLQASSDLISVWTSVSALNLAKELLPRALWEKILKAPALVISTRIQHHLQGQGAKRVDLANGPGNSDLLQSILRLTEE